MSVAGYFGSRADRRLKAGDVAKGVAEVATGLPLEAVDGVAIDTLAGVEEQARAAGLAERPGRRYESVGDYDPVLRAHCRLDRER